MKKIITALIILVISLSAFSETARVCCTSKSSTTYVNVDCLDNIDNVGCEEGSEAKKPADKPLKKSFMDILGGITAIVVSYTFMSLVATSNR